MLKSKPIVLTFSACLLGGLLSTPLWAQDQDSQAQGGNVPTVTEQSNTAQQAATAPGQVPIFRVQVVDRTIDAVNYRVRAGETGIDFRGTTLEPGAKGSAEVQNKNGVTHIEATFKYLQPASAFGAENLTYVLWAITPQGRPINLGEVELPRGSSTAHINASTNLQAFGMVVTAEPYFAVTQPSNLVVLENVVRPSTKGQFEQIHARYQLLQRGTYSRIAPGGAVRPLMMSPKLPLDYYEAINALRIAKWSGAPQWAPQVYQQAQGYMGTVDDYVDRKVGARPIATQARQVVQTAEDARLLSLRRQQADRVAKLRQEQLQREQAANRAAQEAQQQAQAAQQARAEALARQQLAESEAQQAQQQAALAEQQRQAALQQEQATRARLMGELNQVLQTRDTARGLIVNMSDVLFDTGRYNLRPGAQVKLAKVAGILQSFPGLHLQVNGYTDSIGGDEYNLHLSQQRADSVRDFLVSQGVPATSVIAQGFGKADPVASNAIASGRQQNRRVELVVSGSSIGTGQNAGMQTAPAGSVSGNATPAAAAGTSATPPASAPAPNYAPHVSPSANVQAGAGVSAGTSTAGDQAAAQGSVQTAPSSGAAPASTTTAPSAQTPAGQTAPPAGGSASPAQTPQ